MCRLRFHGHPNMHARRTCLSGAHPRAQLAKTSCMLVCVFQLRLTYACIHVCVYACMHVFAYVLWHAQAVCIYVYTYAAKCAASRVLGRVVRMCTTEMPGMPHDCVRDAAQLHNYVRACMHACMSAMLCMRVRGRQACAHSQIRLAAHALRLRAAARRTAKTPNLLRTHARKQQSVRSMLTRRR